MSSKNHTERFGALRDGLREDIIEGRIINWLDNSMSFAHLDGCESSIEDPEVIYGTAGINTRNYGEGFIGMVDVALTIQYGEFEYGIGIECKGNRQGNDIDVMKHGIGQTVIYDQSTYDSYLAAPLNMIDSRGIAAARQADIGLIGITENSIDLIRSNGIFLPYLCEIQYEAASEYATCDYCDDEIDTTASQMENFDYNFCNNECLERWDSELNSAFYS